MFSEFSLGSIQFDVVDFLLKSGEKNTIKILEKTGPRLLSHIAKEENSLTLSVAACERLFLNHDIKRSSIELLLVVTETPVRSFPGNGFEIASEIGLNASVEIVDINAGCTGFVDALSISLRLGKKSLIVCAETYSIHMGHEQRSVKCLFSDAASATFFDPNDFRMIIDKSSYVKNTSASISKQLTENLQMNGPEVFSFGLRYVFPIIESSISDVNRPLLLFIHQGSKLILDTLKSKLAQYELDIPTNLIQRGNCISATIPILMCDSGYKDLRLEKRPILFVGFGVGLYIHVLGLESIV
jgi:3-oxoacyl-[acyl-carrier-protein] synthase-3